MLRLFFLMLTGTCLSSVATAEVLLSDDFGSGTVNTTFRAYENTINSGWRKAPGYNAVVESAWQITGGRVQNDSMVAGTGYPTTQPSESPLMSFISGGGTTEHLLRFEFDYSVAAGDKLYAHLWGYTGTSSTPGGFVSNIEGSNSGNMNVSEGADGSTLDGFNLTNGATSNYGHRSQAISGELTGTGSFSTTFRLSDLGISGVSTAGDLDYYLIQFGKDEDGTAGTTWIDNVRLTATVPEPSSIAFLTVCLVAAVVLQRRRSHAAQLSDN